MKQYAEQKAQVPDAILLFRMGDFYETFYEDARIASRVLGIALTSRNRDSDEPIPLAGIPYHALETYLARLVAAGYKVAISEQVEDPREARGVVRREIVRIVTPGTLTEDRLLDARTSNYLAAVWQAGGVVGLAAVELSGGDFFVQTLPAEEVLDELVRLSPAELLVDESQAGALKGMVAHLTEACGTRVQERAAWTFEPVQGQETLKRHFGVGTLEGFGIEEGDVSVGAAGAVLEYLNETQRTRVEHIRRLRRLDRSGHVQIDPGTWRSLEIDRTLRSGSRDGSLLAAIDETLTAMGGRLLRQWLAYPLRDAGEIRKRQDAVSALAEEASRLRRVREVLRGFADMPRILARVGLSRATPRDLAALGSALERCVRLREEIGPEPAALWRELVGAMQGLDDLGEYLRRALRPDPPLGAREGGIIAEGFDEELDRLREAASGGQEWLAQLQAREARRTGIASLKIGFNRVFGYYIEVPNTQRERVPEDYIRRQTIKNAERYITPELKDFEERALTAQERANEREYELFQQIVGRVGERMEALQRCAEAVAAADVIAALAWLAHTRGYVRPEAVEGGVLEIEEGRHPVLAVTLGRRFVPNDCFLDEQGRRLAIITGPNMAGKSTYIRQVALLVLLAQAGSFVPARRMRWGVVDRLFARVGAADELARGQSTFMVEMTEVANILNNATRDSLVILDEVGRGTSTLDGLSLAWAITEDLARRVRCRTLFATHYHELTELADLLPGVFNLSAAVRESGGQIVFVHRIVEGATDRSYGAHVARLAGVPEEVVRRSEELLAELEEHFHRESHSERVARRRSGEGRQLSLFADLPHPLLEALRAVDPARLTPIEALAKVAEWKERYAGESGQREA